VNRLRISVEGFSHIAEEIFGADSEETYHIRRVIRNEWTLLNILSIKHTALTFPQRENIGILNRVVAKHYLHAGIINASKYLIYKAASQWVLQLLIHGKQFIKQLKPV
jgi:hypothetical protein